jgi:hypothetical protein
MRKRKSEVAALIFAIISLILFFIPELMQIEVVGKFRLASALFLLAILVLAFIAADQKQKLILGGIFLVFGLFFTLLIILN